MNKILKKIILMPFNILYRISPELDLKILFRLKCGFNLDLHNPKTYNEKLNWLKLYYRNDLMPICADKYAARKYISDLGYEEYLPKLYWHGDNVYEIPFSKLPNEFVIKSTTGSGNNIIVKKKQDLDFNVLTETLKKWLKEDYLPAYGEWHYAKIKPSIIIEELLNDNKHFVPLDFKFMCFNNYNSGGVNVGCVCVDIGRFEEHKRLIFDSDWNFIPNIKFCFDNKTDEIISRPKRFDEMCKVAKRLADPFPHSRIDFYVIGDSFYIGEITFFNGAGFDLVTPYEMNEKIGGWIKLPSKTT